MIKSAITGLLFILLLVQCSSENEKAFNRLINYQNTILGWEVHFSNEWNIVIDDSLDVQETAKGNLICNKPCFFGLQKDEYNMLESSVEPYKEDVKKEWMNDFQGVKKILVDLYSSKSIKVDTSATDSVSIGGRVFLNYQTILYDEHDEIRLHQNFYATLLNDHDFSVCLSYNNEQDKIDLLEIWKSSQFN